MTDHRSIDALEQPAMIIDTARPAICATNGPGRQLWGLDDGIDMPVALDPAMPALTRLQHSTASAGHRESAAVDDALQPLPAMVFWTAAGAQSLRCEVQKGPDPDTVLVVFEAIATTEPRLCPAETVVPESAQPASEYRIDTHAMAHELRTPIGAIIALAEMIETEQFGPIGDQRYRAYARDIGDSARLSLNIVASALDRDASSHAGLLSSFAELSVTDLISKCLRTVRQSALESGVTLTREIPDDLPKLIANATGLTQVLLNLLTNAIKFTPADGTVTVAAALSEDGRLTISVRDTGVGMTGIDANVLIADGRDMADTTPSSRRGIGFSLVRRLACAMAAEFDVTSARGVGTRVSLTFPAAKVIPVMRDIADR
ncbi:MAG: sensor histidine kinase [Hyphomicrobiaceae bacterium]